MAHRRTRAFFPAVTIVVLVLTVFGSAVLLLRQAIPPPPPNDLSGLDEFLGAGSRQFVRWKPLSDAAFAEAQRLGKPLFIVIGSQASSAARQADRTSFMNQDVVERLRQGYVCVRVDTDQTPDWLNCLLPVSRVQIGGAQEGRLWFEPSFQAMVLTPDRKLVSWVVRHAPQQRMEPPFFLENLQTAKERMARVTGDPTRGTVAILQKENASVLVQPQAHSKPDLLAHRSWILGHTLRGIGGIPVNGFQVIQPSMWRFLLTIGDFRTLQESMSPALASGVVDWLDGGFFRLAQTPQWTWIEFDKLAVQNAEMAALLAKHFSLTGDKLSREIALRTLDCLTGPFRRQGFISSYRIVRSFGDRLSARNSFPPGLLRQEFNPTDRDWLRKYFGLRLESNPQMIPILSGSEFLETDREKAQKMLDKLRAVHDDAQMEYGKLDLLDVNAFVCARLLEAARCLGDQRRIATASQIFDHLSVFRVGTDDVIHGTTGTARSYRYAGDYLSYADASLEHFRSFGKEDVLLDGARVLERALFLYGDEIPGVIVNGRFENLSSKPLDAVVPELADNLRESTVAIALRLCYRYGVLFTGTKRGKLLRDWAQSIALQYGQSANRLQNGVSGFFCASAEVLDDSAVLISGPGRLNESERLEQKTPLRFVSPMPESFAKPAGIYRAAGGKLFGPIASVNLDKSLPDAR